MKEDFDISQEETGFPLPKQGNFAFFAPVNKLARLAYLSQRHVRDAYVLRHPMERPPLSTYIYLYLFV